MINCRRRVELIVLIYILIGYVAVNSDNKIKLDASTETPENQNTPKTNNENIKDEVEQLITNSTEKNYEQNEQPIEQQQQQEDANDKQEIRPCTCGIFLSNKVKKQKLLVNEEPTLTQELEKKYPCTKLGIRQCQNDCFQTMIKYLPKSGDIICGLINEDIYKLRAHLFIQNCDNKWHNSNLVAGREYCCANAKPYTCPLK